MLPKSNIAKILFIFLGIIVISLIANKFIASERTLFINSDLIRDTEYGFEFTDMRGWKHGFEADGQYLFIVSQSNKNGNGATISVSPQIDKSGTRNFQRIMNEDKTLILTKQCSDLNDSKSIHFIGVVKENITNGSGYKCTFTYSGTQTKGGEVVPFIQERYYFYGPKSDIILSVHYQNTQEEKENIKRFVQGFKFL